MSPKSRRHPNETRASSTYEPAFGAIVAVLAVVLFCFVLIAPRQPHTSYIGIAFLLIVCARAVSWGVAQVVGYRRALLAGTALPAPLLGTALGCVFLGLMIALVAVLFHEFARDHPLYSVLFGGASALLLVIGAVVGIRQGIWRGDEVTPNNSLEGSARVGNVAAGTGRYGAPAALDQGLPGDPSTSLAAMFGRGALLGDPLPARSLSEQLPVLLTERHYEAGS
jgi:hypothetical protein